MKAVAAAPPHKAGGGDGLHKSFSKNAAMPRRPQPFTFCGANSALAKSQSAAPDGQKRHFIKASDTKFPQLPYGQRQKSSEAGPAHLRRPKPPNYAKTPPSLFRIDIHRRHHRGDTTATNPTADALDDLKLRVAPHLVEDLGINLYTTLAQVLVEYIANAHDADASQVFHSVTSDESAYVHPIKARVVFANCRQQTDPSRDHALQITVK